MATESNETKGSTRDVVLPGTVTDLVKAVREILGLAKDLREFAGWGIDALDKGHRRRAAKSVDALTFGPDLTRRPLERIAAGQGTADDYELIARRLGESAGTVEESVARLERYRDRLREAYGLAAANKLTDVLRGYRGKLTLRDALMLMVDDFRGDLSSTEALQYQAQHILISIDQLNADLIQLHDLIIEPARP
ncbi:hypothetical protein SAMN05443245_0472 [Paraburkholderia fungorum]|uniref:Uncharacterized protein n=1 Tax=Paraburkholderia fungorum TaxID=134537 RepID=A0A1H0Z6X3_9BURK|nr:hypothetical protein [Paraburkholderia fungorum]SDQ22891.1 hypothetical protein SAMN05443245_0472 [Paraburkholderia fungorum]